MKRTKKEFTPYNEYHDRPFELKWATAFALGELQEGIEASDEYSKRAFERLPQQTTEEIEEYLEQSLKNNQFLEIQLNTLDDFGRVQPPIVGVFEGMSSMEYAKVGHTHILFEEIRHIKSHEFTKWSSLD